MKLPGRGQYSGNVGDTLLLGQMRVDKLVAPSLLVMMMIMIMIMMMMLMMKAPDHPDEKLKIQNLKFR